MKFSIATVGINNSAMIDSLVNLTPCITIIDENHHKSQSAIIAHMYELGHVISETKLNMLGVIRIIMWVDIAVLNRYLSKSREQIIISKQIKEVIV